MMQIKNESKELIKRLHEVPPGDVFIKDGSYYIVGEEEKQGKIECWHTTKASSVMVDAYCNVVHYSDTELVIKG